MVTLAAAMFLGLLLMVLAPTVYSSNSAQPRPEGWQTIFTEDFESGLGANTVVTNLSATASGEYMWGAAPFTHTGSITSAWSVGGGADGSGLVAGTDTYTDNLDTWLVYGPFTLTEVFQADLFFDWWLDSTPGDWFGWCLMTGGIDFEAGCAETRIAGHISTWVSGTVSLDAYARTDTPLFLAFHFTSDDDSQAGKGAFIDNLILRGDYGQTLYLPLIRRDPTPTPTPPQATVMTLTTHQVVGGRETHTDLTPTATRPAASVSIRRSPQ
jgi:hypothetical protein